MCLKSLFNCKEDYYKNLLVLETAITTELQKKVEELQAGIEGQEVVWDEGIQPDWLDTAQKPYCGKVEVEGVTVELKPQDIYMECPSLREIATKWRNLPLDQKLWEIWKYVITSITYEYDKNENWQPSIITLERKKGDCEDGTILFVTLARLAHIPADCVFNATGWYYASNGDKIGHSFPVARMQNNELYIFESTLNTIPTDPKRLLGSNYEINWGVSNWKFAGRIKTAFNKGGDKVQL